MSLRIKTGIITAVLVLGVFVVLYILSQTVLLSSFEQLEAREMRQNAERLQTAIDDALLVLSSNTQDYARWDESYRFIQDLNTEFSDVELSDEIVANLNINLLLYADAGGKVVFTKAVDIPNMVSVSPPADLEAQLPANSPLFQSEQNGAGVTGLLALKDGILLVASRPVVDSLGTQPSRGFLVMGRFLDDDELASLSAGLRLPITLRRTGTELEPEFEAASTALNNTQIYTQPLGGNIIAGYIGLKDMNGQQVALLRAEQVRETYEQGTSTISSFFVLLLITGALFVAITLLTVERFILSPMSRLTRNVKRIATSGDPAERLTVTGGDELASLGRDINTMLEQLNQSQIALHEHDVRLRTVVTGSPILLWAIDQQERLTLAEGLALGSLGINPKTAAGKTASEVLVNMPHFLEEIRRAAKGEEFSSTIPLGDRTFDMHFSPITGDDGAFAGVFGVATDVTDRVKAEQKLTTTYNDLARQNQRLKRVSELLQSTVSVMTETVKRGAPKEELLEYMTFVYGEMNELN